MTHTVTLTVLSRAISLWMLLMVMIKRMVLVMVMIILMAIYAFVFICGCDDVSIFFFFFFQIGAGLYAVGRPVQKRNDEDGQIGTIQSLPLERGASFNRFFGEPAHGPPHVAGGASGPIGGCRDESRTDNPDLDLRHVFDRNNRKTDLI